MKSSATYDGLTRAFCPRSVAVIGAADDIGRISGRPLYYMAKSGFTGTIYPVNNRRETVQGMRAYPSLGDLPETPDTALICLPAGAIEGAVKDCVARGVGSAVVFASGFAELGADGVRVQNAIADAAKAGGLRLFGPNCLGLFHTGSGYIGTFASLFDYGMMDDGPVAIVSQSGAYAAHLAHLCRERNMGIGYWASTGNEADVDVAECIAWLARRDDVSVIMAYAEGVRDGRALIDALHEAHARRKPVIFMKAGESKVGSAAAQSHTATLAGEAAIYDAVFAEYGVHRVRTAEEHVDVAYACSQGRFPKGPKVGLVSLSGGFGIQMSDAAERYGLDVAPMPTSAKEKLKQAVPFGNMDNPCDVTAGALNDMGTLTTTVKTLYEEGGYDAVVGSFTILPASPSYGPRMKEAIIAGAQGHLDHPTVLCMLAGDDVVRSYESEGFLVYSDGERAIRSLAALYRLRADFDRRVVRVAVDESLRRNLGTRTLSEAGAQALLREAGLPFPSSEVATSAEQAAQAWARLGQRVAMKILSPDILHKTEIGGVALGIDSADRARSAYGALLANAAAHAPAAHIDGVLVVPMAPEGVEVILGAKIDPVFGPVVVVGLGGIFTELLQDVSLRCAPVSRATAHAMIAEIAGYPLLRGYRGSRPSDVEALASAIAQLSQFAAANADQIESIEINPVRVLEAGRGVLALDAVVALSHRSHAS